MLGGGGVGREIAGQAEDSMCECASVFSVTVTVTYYACR